MSSPTAADVQTALARLANPEIAEHSQRFFKIGPGEYGEGDRFRGIRVPAQRKVAASFRELPLDQAEALLASPYHEDRLTALFILVLRFEKGDAGTREGIFRLYLARTDRVNNWDLVDGSAHQIVGGWLRERDRSILHEFGISNSLWERRIAIVSTYHFIKLGEFDDTLAVAEILRDDPHDLIHKAVGWMLREVGNRDRQTEERFLRGHYRSMPRTMLRYAIEKFPEAQRQAYLRGDA